MDIPFSSKNISVVNNIVFPKSEIANRVSYSKFVKELIQESKGKVTTDEFNWIDAQGEWTAPHKSRNWQLYKDVYDKVSVVANAIKNTANFAIQSGYQIESENKNAKKKVEEWIRDKNFDLIMLKILLQMQIYGNAYLEISSLNLLNPKNMYVVTYKGGSADGVIKGYKQVIGPGKETIVMFTPDEIVHFKWNDDGTDFYGNSDIRPILTTVTRLLQFQEDIGEVMHHYSNPILHHKLGTEQAPATDTTIDAYKELLDEREIGEDWITSSAVEIVPVVSNLRMIQIDGIIEHFENQLIAGLCVPEIFIRGGKTANKATADVELQAFDRKVKSLRAVLSRNIEDRLFKDVAKTSDVLMAWNEMGVEGEEVKSKTVMNLSTAGVPTICALKIVGWGSWVDEVEEEIKKNPPMPSLMPQPFGKSPKGNQPQKPVNKDEKIPPEEDFETQADWVEAVSKTKLIK